MKRLPALTSAYFWHLQTVHEGSGFTTLTAKKSNKGDFYKLRVEIQKSEDVAAALNFL